MAVLIPNCTLVAHARTHPITVRDAHGVPVPSDSDTVEDRGPYPSGADESEEGWTLRLDPRVHPLRAGDSVTEPSTGRKWTLTADAIPHFLPGHPAADYVSAKVTLNPPRVH